MYYVCKKLNLNPECIDLEHRIVFLQQLEFTSKLQICSLKKMSKKGSKLDVSTKKHTTHFPNSNILQKKKKSN